MRIEALEWRPESGWQGGGGESADLVLYFGAADTIGAAGAPAVLSARYPGAVVLGCSSAACIRGAAIDEDGIAGVACRFRDTEVRLVAADVAEMSCSARAGRQLGDSLKGEGLSGALLLSDGVQVNGSALTSALVEAVGSEVAISGGLAADGARYVHTTVGAGTTARSGRAVALGFYGRSVRLAHGSGGGWEPFGPRRRITRSRGCVLEELDGKPALALYERYLGDEAAGLPGSALLFPLLVWDPQAATQTVVRTVLSIDREAGSMRFAGDVPLGWGAQLMRGNIDGLVDAAASAGRTALDRLDRSADGQALALLVSCVGRQLLLGQRTAEELHAVDVALGPQVDKIGFYSHGEVAPNIHTGQAMLQNQTMAITLVTEAA